MCVRRYEVVQSLKTIYNIDFLFCSQILGIFIRQASSEALVLTELRGVLAWMGSFGVPHVCQGNKSLRVAKISVKNKWYAESAASKIVRYISMKPKKTMRRRKCVECK